MKKNKIPNSIRSHILIWILLKSEKQITNIQPSRYINLSTMDIINSHNEIRINIFHIANVAQATMWSCPVIVDPGLIPELAVMFVCSEHTFMATGCLTATRSGPYPGLIGYRYVKIITWPQKTEVEEPISTQKIPTYIVDRMCSKLYFTIIGHWNIGIKLALFQIFCPTPMSGNCL